MSVARKNYAACIGCKNCVNRCPMDVFYYDAEKKKSVIAYPENCQSCGQCYLACSTDSLCMVDTCFEYSPIPVRGLRTFSSAMPVVKEKEFGKPTKEQSWSGKSGFGSANH